MRTLRAFPLVGFPLYGMDGTDAITAEFPRDAVIRHVGMLDSRPILWAETDDETTDPPHKRSFISIMASAGSPMVLPSRSVYVGSYTYGPFLRHLYELAGEDPNGWTEWAGDDEPPADTHGKVVDVRLRDGTEATGPAAIWHWGHHVGTDPGEIVAYRISAEQPEG